jgi:branched-chain amino acid transport system ATP-binding protein
MLTLHSVAKNFRGLHVLKDVNFTVPEAGIFGLIGPNGAGKTTIFNLVSGLLAPSSGTIEFNGRRLDGMAPHRVTRSGIARTFQNLRIFREMDLLDNVLVGMPAAVGEGGAAVLWPSARYRAATERARSAALALLAQVGLADKANRLAGSLAYGEQRRLEIARALATQPKLLLLDEPAAGMNGAEKQQLMGDLRGLQSTGVTLLVIEHDMRFVMGLCQEIAVLNFGQLIALGSPDEIRRNPEVIEAYLGEDDDAVRLNLSGSSA